MDELAIAVDTCMTCIEHSLREQEQAIDRQTKLVKRSIKDTHAQETLYTDMVKGTCSNMVAKVSAKVASIPQSLVTHTVSKEIQDISKVFDDFLENDKRKNNPVVHNLPESDVTFAQRGLRGTQTSFRK